MTMLARAERSVDCLASSQLDFPPGVTFTEMARAPNQSVDLRCIVGHIPEHPGWGFAELSGPSSGISHAYDAQGARELADALRSDGWAVQCVSQIPSIDCVIIDDREALVADGLDPSGRFHRIVTRQDVLPLVQHFSRLWSGADELVLIYDDLLVTTAPGASEAVVTASKERWGDLIAYFRRDPAELRVAEPRALELLVAKLLEREDMEVHVTSPSKDGGYDILARAETRVGHHLYLVECKRYSPKHRVGVELARALYGIVEQERATSGLIVTTSSFTKGAMDFRATVENRLGFVDFEGLLRWLAELESEPAT